MQADKDFHKWICLQLGGREYYSIPRALNLSKQLAGFFTDLWCAGGIKFLGQTLKADRILRRSHSDLKDFKVGHTGIRSLLWELYHSKIANQKSWELILERNKWFQNQAVHFLKEKYSDKKDIILFSYSYTAKEPFEYAKSRGWKTILGQLDPGPYEEDHIEKQTKEATHYYGAWEKAPLKYWQDWHAEAQLADLIIVNSDWSLSCLINAGVPKEKIRVIPLAYESKCKADNKKYPEQFSAARPLRVLFLGQQSIRKGIHILLQAAERLLDYPVEFILAGKPEAQLNSLKNVLNLGRVSNEKAEHLLQTSDVFIFPSLSEGFGMTQLEAQSWKLPLIVSKNCAKVINDGESGIILEEVSADAIVEAIKRCLRNPAQLQRFSDQSIDLENYGIHNLARQFLQVEGDLQ